MAYAEIVRKNHNEMGCSRIYLARQWQQDLSEGKYRSQADLSRNLGVSRARVTQVLNLLKLPREMIEKVCAMGDPLIKPIVTERSLRRILKNTY